MTEAYTILIALPLQALCASIILLFAAWPVAQWVDQKLTR